MWHALLKSFVWTYFIAVLDGASVGRRRLVYPHVIEARSDGDQLTLFIDEDTTLSLQPADVFSKSFLLQYEEGGTPVKQYMNGMELNKMVYHDTDQRAAVSLERDNGLRVHGIIRDSLRIRPVGISGRSSAGRILHEIFEDDEHFSNTRGDYIAVKPLQPAQLIKERDIEVPDTVRPEILMMVGSDKYKTRIKPLTAALYYGVLMASVNNRYSSMSNPKLKVKLCSVKIMSNGLKTKLHELIEHDGISYLDARATLFNLRKEVKKTSYDSYDAVLMSTNEKLATIEDSIVTPGLNGYAFEGAVCIAERVGIVEDDGLTLQGVTNIAHELGHLERRFECLRIEGHDTNLDTKRLPGSFTTPNETCKKEMGARNHADGFHEDKDNLLQRCFLRCKTPRDEKGSSWSLNVTADDGTSCSKKPPKHCIAGECVSVSE
ncbi:uncharacterized protein LOC115321139 [Ixodes scapularis]|uniref:uncharacterized protein LOC115321139 n=1 Tax=Ixodes scapularis TaxID=6945 RepID=UPI001A9CC110|nr:uncharacterized protein LOC115321139 [Ixodes scapularis]